MLEAIDAASPDSRIVVPDTLIAPLLVGPTFDPITATLDALTTAGRLPLIRSPEPRAALATWPSRLADARDEELQARNFLERELIPRLSEAATELTPSDFVVDWLYGTLLDGRESGQGTLHVSSGLRNLIGVRLYYGGGVVEELESLAGTTDELIALLNKVADSR